MYIIAVKDERGALISEHRLSQGRLDFGRTPESAITLASSAVSRQHAHISLKGQHAYITDLGSSNGVFVDEKRVRNEQAVDENSRIRIAEFIIELEPIPQSLEQPGISTAVVAPEDAHGKLVVLSGRQVGREILLFEPVVTIGRIDENDVCLPDISVSRHHSRLHVQDDGTYVLQDLGSSNGTHVLGRKITRPMRVIPGDRVHFGKIECLVSRPEGQSPARRGGRRMVLYLLLVAAAAILGAITSLVMMQQ